MKLEKISAQQRYDCLRTAVRGRFPCNRITATEQWLATVSHEIKNPLTAIIMAATVLKRKPEMKDVVERFAQSILRSAEALRVTVEELLDLSRLDAGACSLKREWVNASLIGERVSARQAPIAVSRGIELIVEVSGRLYCDPDRVIQALVNLVGNALKFTDRGRVVLRGRQLDENYIFTVEDTGNGIAAEDIPRVFDRYWQAESKQKAIGTGLGLAIVKGIVEAHDGVAKVRSVVGLGTEFILEFPIPMSA